MILATETAPDCNLESIQEARHLRRLALDAVERFRRIVDDADDAMVEAGADQVIGKHLVGLWKRLAGLVGRAAEEVREAIRAAHLATGAPEHNCCVVTDEGDVLLLEDTDDPLHGERSFFDWPYVEIRVGMAIHPDR